MKEIIPLMEDCPFNVDDTVVYGPLMTDEGFTQKKLLVHCPNNDRPYYPYRSDHAKAGLCVLGRRHNVYDHFILVTLQNISSLEACPEELVHALKTSPIQSPLAKVSRDSMRFYKCWNEEHDDFIFMAMTHNNVFWNDYSSNDPRVRAAFNGLDPNREGAYPFNPKAVIFVKRSFGNVQVVRTGRYSTAYLYNTYPYGEPLSLDVTSDDIFSRLLMTDPYTTPFKASYFLNSLVNVNRNEDLTEKPVIYRIKGRIIMFTPTKGCYVMSRKGNQPFCYFLCESNRFKEFTEFLKNDNVQVDKLVNAMDMMDKLCIPNESAQQNRLTPDKVISRLTNPSDKLTKYINNSVIQGYLQDNGEMTLKLNWTYSTQRKLACVKRVFKEVDAYHSSLDTVMPMWTDDILG